MAGISATLWPAVMRKIEKVPRELGGLAEISRQRSRSPGASSCCLYCNLTEEGYTQGGKKLNIKEAESAQFDYPLPLQAEKQL